MNAVTKTSLKVSVKDSTAIRVWSFEDAPEEFKKLSWRKNQAWIILVPRKFLKKEPFSIPSWIKNFDFSGDPLCFSTEKGELVFVGDSK